MVWDDDVMEAMDDWDARGGVYATCPLCGHEHWVEPDAENYECHTPGCPGKVTSPLVKAGLI